MKRTDAQQKGPANSKDDQISSSGQGVTMYGERKNPVATEPEFKVIADACFIGYLAENGKFESYTQAQAKAVDYHHSFLVKDMDAYDEEGSLTFVRYDGDPIITIKGTPAIDPYSPKSSLMISRLARLLVANGADPAMPIFIDQMGFTHAEAPYQEKEIGRLVEWAARNQEKAAPAKKVAKEKTTGAEVKPENPGNTDRGFITLGDSGGKRRFEITLLENADQSTFMHEASHLFLEVLGDLAEDTYASERTRKDFGIVLDWLGLQSRNQIKAEHHERFARASEAYLMQGRSPDRMLQPVFRRFCGWLKGIYKKVENLNVTMTPEIRGVFDRLYSAKPEMSEKIEKLTTESGLSDNHGADEPARSTRRPKP